MDNNLYDEIKGLEVCIYFSFGFFCKERDDGEDGKVLI